MFTSGDVSWECKANGETDMEIREKHDRGICENEKTNRITWKRASKCDRNNLATFEYFQNIFDSESSKFRETLERRDIDSKKEIVCSQC